MSTSAHLPADAISSPNTKSSAIDLRRPFWILTGALVFAGLVSTLRIIFTGPTKWAEALGLLGMLLWLYFGQAAGLFQWYFNWSPRRVRSIPQFILNTLSFFVFEFVFLTWTGTTASRRILITASIVAIFLGLFGDEKAPEPTL